VAWASCQPYILAGNALLLALWQHLRGNRRTAALFLATASLCKGSASTAAGALIAMDLLALPPRDACAIDAGGCAGTKGAGKKSGGGGVSHGCTCSASGASGGGGGGGQRYCSAGSGVIQHGLRCMAANAPALLAAAFGVWAAVSSNETTAEPARPLLWREVALRACYAPVFYLRTTLAPTGLNVRYAVPDAPLTVSQPWLLAPLLLVVGSAALVCARLVLAGRRFGCRRWAVAHAPWRAAAGIGGAALFLLLPTLGFVQHGYLTLAADRYCYLPALALVPLAGIVAEAGCGGGGGKGSGGGKASGGGRGGVATSMPALAAAAAAAAAAAVVALSHTARAEVPVYRSNLHLWARASQRDPRYADAFANLCDAQQAAATGHAGMAGNVGAGVRSTSRGGAAGGGGGGGGDGPEGSAEELMRASAASGERAVALDPAHHSAWLNLGSALQTLGRAGGAEHAYATAASLKPHKLEAHYNLGTLLAPVGGASTARAVGHLERALEIDPTHSRVLFNLGTALIETDPKRAPKVLQRAVAAAEQLRGGRLRNVESVAGAMGNLALAWSKAGRHGQAAEAQEGVVGLRREDADSAAGRAGRRPAAAAALLEALHAAGTARHQAGELALAARHYRAALKIDKNHPQTQANYGIALLAMEPPDARGARRAFEAVLRMRPGEATAVQGLRIAKEKEAAGKEAAAAGNFDER
jgi:Tfp pilus assembly protein PilF